MKRTIAISILIAAAALVASVRAAIRMRPPRFPAPQARGMFADAARSDAEFLPDVHTNFVHGATLAELPNGDLLAAWYGGTDEVYNDVCIFSSRRDHLTGRWSAPRTVETQRDAERALGIRVKSLGNPVLLADDRGVTMFYVAVLFGGWSGGTICMKTSPDGVAWSEPKRVFTSPLLNIGMLVRSKPWRYTDGTIALPVYHELRNKWAAIARIDQDGRVIDVERLPNGRSLFQPWLVPTGTNTAVVFLRWSTRRWPGSVTMTKNDGDGWTPVQGTPLIQRDSAVAGLRLNDGSLLVAYNNSAWDRRDLSMARSPDDGEHWSRPHPLEHDSTPNSIVRREYSYPYFLQTRDGRYHVVYTWQRKLIRHVVFNDAWVMGDEILGATRE